MDKETLKILASSGDDAAQEILDRIEKRSSLTPARILYPDAATNYEWDDGEGFTSQGDYSPMVESFGEVLLRADDQDYQGDSRILYKSGDRFGLLIFGWGSCSGCDSLQACSSYEELDELIEQTKNSIKWFDSREEAARYFNEHDWRGEFSWYHQETRDFVRKCIEYLDPGRELSDDDFADPDY